MKLIKAYATIALFAVVFGLIFLLFGSFWTGFIVFIAAAHLWMLFEPKLIINYFASFPLWHDEDCGAE